MGSCFICGKERKALVDHHICWDPEKTIPVCPSCHTRIHSNSPSVVVSPSRRVRGKSYRRNSLNKKERGGTRTKYGITDDAFLPKMIECCVDDRERGMVYILYYTGMHGSLLRSLTLDNLKYEGESIYLRWQRTKSGKVMEAPIPKSKLDIIQGFLLSRKYSIRWTNVLLGGIGERAGYDDVSTMTFRHTRTIQLIKDGVPLPVIAEVMGCTTEVISRNYGKLTETQKRNEVLR